VFFDRSEFNDTLHITFAVNGNYDTPSQPTGASRSTVKILSTVLNIVKQKLPEYMAKARPPAVSFTAKGDNRTSLYRKYFVPVIQNILGAKWQHEEYPNMGMTVFHWRPVKKQGVTEAFDQPYAVEWRKQNGDWHATADLDDGSELIVLFMAQGDNSWMVEFERDENMDITGEGDAQRVFATVLLAMQQFIAKRKPVMLNFSAEKEDDPTGSRARLYDRMIQRYISGTGYDLTRKDVPGGATYTLTKQAPGVAEGLDDNGISFQVQKGKNKFATTLSMGNNPVGVYQYNATTGRSIAEVYPEFKGKGLGKLLVLHAIYTATQLGLDFQEDESRTSEYDNVLDSLSSNGYIVDDDGYWYVTGEGEQYLKQSLKQDVAENFADGKNPGRKGLAKRSGVNTKASVSSLRKTAKHSSGEKQRMAHWLANMKAGRAKAKK